MILRRSFPGLLAASLAVAAHAAPPDAPGLVEHGLQAEFKLRQVDPAFAGDGEGIASAALRPWWLRQTDATTLDAVTAKVYASDDYDEDVDPNPGRNASRNYVEVTELWRQRQRAGDARYALRAGVQKIDDGASRWWSTPLTGVRAAFEGTLASASLAAGSRANFLRSNWDDSDPRAEHGWIVAGAARRQWRLDQFAGVRGLLRVDDDPGYQVGERVDRARLRREPVQALWLGADLAGERRHDDSPDYQRYWLELGAAAGRSTRVATAGTSSPDAVTVAGLQPRDITGLLLRAEVQQVWERDWTWRLGGNASLASGGDGAGKGGYVGTGLASYRDTLFGTEARGHLNGEAMRLEPGNAMIAGLHAAASPRRGHEFLLMLRKAWRSEAGGEIVQGGTVLPGGAGRAIGDSIDLVYSWRQRPWFSERTLRRDGFEGTHLQLTWSHFDPAYADPGRTVQGDVLSVDYVHAF